MDDHTDRTQFRLLLEMHVTVQDAVALRARVLTSTADAESPGNDDLAQLVRRVIGHALRDVGDEAGFTVNNVKALSRHYGLDDSYPGVSLPSATEDHEP